MKRVCECECCRLRAAAVQDVEHSRNENRQLCAAREQDAARLRDMQVRGGARRGDGSHDTSFITTHTHIFSSAVMYTLVYILLLLFPDAAEVQTCT